MTPTFDPIAPWPLVLLVAALVVVLTVWAYRKRLNGTTGRWRWFALGLRMAAVVMCLLAALKPSLLLLTKVKQTAAVIFLIDASSSMEIADEADGQSRWDAAKKVLADALNHITKKTGPKLEVKVERFDAKIQDYKLTDTAPPKGRETALGTALDQGYKLAAGTRVVSEVLLSDGNSNSGLSPLSVAQRLKAQQIPVVAVGFGSESAGKASRDVSAREIVAGPVVFVKNVLPVRGSIGVRGYDNQEIEVELYVEDGPRPVDSVRIRTKPGATKDGFTLVPITNLKWRPEKPGETKLALRVKPLEGEQIATNNQIETYVSVQKGGLAVLYIQGPNFSWEPKYLTRALDSAQEIQADLRVIRRPVSEDPSVLPNEELAPGKYDVLVLGDVPAKFLTEFQHKLLVEAVKRGAGLIMLGGRSSFGAGGWADTAVDQILPVQIHPGDGQMKEEQGIPFKPNPLGLENYILRLSSNPNESGRIWSAMPPLPGANRLGPAKEGATILAAAPDGEPLMVSQNVPKGRVLAFAGETWPWARDLLHDESRAAHRRLWRQMILWLAQKEDQGENQVKLTLDRRRVAIAQKLEVTATARDAKNEPIADVKYDTKVELIGPKPTVETLDLFNQGKEARNNYFPTGQPGEYKVTTVGKRNGVEIGSDTARFIVYQDDRELENPAADHALLRQIAQITGGKTLAPEQLGKYLKALDGEVLTDTVVQKEVRLWDNWPFLLIFATLLTLEWFLRKRHGWV
jgi:uncharacterized membrane protein